HADALPAQGVRQARRRIARRVALEAAVRHQTVVVREGRQGAADLAGRGVALGGPAAAGVERRLVAHHGAPHEPDALVVELLSELLDGRPAGPVLGPDQLRAPAG